MQSPLFSKVIYQAIFTLHGMHQRRHQLSFTYTRHKSRKTLQLLLTYTFARVFHTHILCSHASGFTLINSKVHTSFYFDSDNKVLWPLTSCQCCEYVAYANQWHMYSCFCVLLSTFPVFTLHFRALNFKQYANKCINQLK